MGEQGIGFFGRCSLHGDSGRRRTVTVLAQRAGQVHCALLHAYLEITCRNFNTVPGSASNHGENF